MKFNKKATIRNLKNLEETITDYYMTCDINVERQCYDDIMFVRGLMDDIECGRITSIEA